MKNELIKASNAIHIAHNLSLLQAQLWDFILAQTPQEEILSPDNLQHQLSLAIMLKFLGNTRNSNYLKTVLESMSSVVTYTVINKDGNEWGMFPLFTHAQVRGGIFYYEYPATVKRFLGEPHLYMYSRINLSTLRKFACKYSMFLYQLCLDYKNVMQTPTLPLEKFCAYMGVSLDSYESFSLLNFHVIKRATREVNKKTELVIKAIYQRDGKKTEAIKFSVLDKEGISKRKIAYFMRSIN
jgi:plasmid replication initiation protein